VDGANPGVHVHGCSWPSVAVDVPTDVGKRSPSAVIFGYSVIWMFVTIKYLNDHRLILIMNAGTGWHPDGLTEPDHAAAWGSPRRNRCVRRAALSSGCRVLAEGDEGMPPSPPDPAVATSLLEGVNSLVQAAKARARGYRSKTKTITIVCLISAKLSLPTFAHPRPAYMTSR
jgi:hypothetical protein